MISQELLDQLKEELTKNTYQRFPNEEKKLKKYLHDFEDYFKISNAIVAGGCITSLFTASEINDVDVYFRSKEDLSRFLCAAFSTEMGYLKLMHMTNRSVLLSDHNGLKIQLIVYKFFDSVQDVFNAFDFSVNMGAYDFKEDNFVLDERFMRHNAQRYIEINAKTDYPLISVLRVDKYREKGYRISKPQMLALLLRVSTLEMDSWDDALDHLGGMYGIDPEKLFDRTKDFSLEEAISQLQALETVDGKFIPNDPSFKDLAENLQDKLTEETKNALIAFAWDNSEFLEIAYPDDETQLPAAKPSLEVPEGLMQPSPFMPLIPAPDSRRKLN